MDYGVFVALPGKQKALVHFTELRGNRDALRRERMAKLKVGDKIFVEIIPSKKAGKVSASEKVVYNDIIMENLPVNEVLEGVISGLSEYGAFVVIDDYDVAGLVHVSRLNCKRDEREAALKALNVGDKMKVLVTGMEFDKNNEVVVALTQSDKPLEDVEIWDTIETLPE
jgi:ribosomal protein S1